MENDEIKLIFPMTLTISNELIASSENIGTSLLKSALPHELHDDIFWGLSIGSIKGVLIKTEKEIIHDGKKCTTPFYLQRSDIKEPMDITFKLRQKPKL